MTSFLLGIDIGTSSTKAAVIDLDGKIYGIGQCEYPISTPKVGWSEQQPEMWWKAVIASVHCAFEKVRNLTPKDICGIGLSGQMHGLVPLDKQANVLYPAIIWSDQRSEEQVKQYYDLIGKERLGQLCANPVATGFAGPSLLWIKQNKPELYAQINVIIQPKDYIRYKMLGKIETEITDACGTLLFDTANGVWSKELCKELGLDNSKLPETVAKPWELAGLLTEEAASALGLASGTPVAYGGADQTMQAIGNGIIQTGTVSVTIGTGGQVFTPIHTPKFDNQLRMHTFCHAIENTWNIMGATLSAGLSLKWFRDEILGGMGYQLLDDSVSKVHAGSEGLIFLPYLVGERTPYMDSKARGVFIGLTLRHTRAHMLRAVMEGVALALWQSLVILNQMDIPINMVIASGGGANSQVWRQILADVLNCPIAITATTEQACVGAAIMGGVASNIFESVESAVNKIVPKPTIQEYPLEGNVKIYNILKVLFTQTYIDNKATMQSLCDLAENTAKSIC